MVGFRVLSSISEMEFKLLPISSQTILVGDLLEQLVGATTWTVCTSTSNFFSRKAIAYAAATSSDTQVLCYEVRGIEKVEAESVGAAAAADIGDRMVLTDKNTVNNTGTDSASQNACFIMDGLGSVASSMIGRILVGNGVDPDAS